MTNLNQTNGYNVSDRYKVINTETVLSQFENEGFVIENVRKAAVRKAEKQGFQKHLIRMSHPNLDFKIDGLRPEIILKNSFDGTTCFNLKIGVYRLICSNGLEVGADYKSETIKHVGPDIMKRVLEAAERIKMGIPLMGEQIKEFQSLKLTEFQALKFAFDIGESLVSHRSNVFHLNSKDLLTTRRGGDNYSDLWTVLNRVQENAIKGAYRYQSEVYDKETDTKCLKLRHARETKSLDKISKINVAVWDTALKLVA